MRDTRDPRVVMPGAIYGEGYRELGSHCFAYIHATEVGGTHPALIEAMGRGALVLYRNTPENAEVAGDAGIPFEPAELAAKMRMVLDMSEEQREELRRKAMERIRERYSWDSVTDGLRGTAAQDGSVSVGLYSRPSAVFMPSNFRTSEQPEQHANLTTSTVTEIILPSFHGRSCV